MGILERKKDRENSIILGFILEVFTFVSAGFLLNKSIILSSLIFIAALVLALVVGKQIENNAIINFKYGLE